MAFIEETLTILNICSIMCLAINGRRPRFNARLYRARLAIEDNPGSSRNELARRSCQWLVSIPPLR